MRLVTVHFVPMAFAAVPRAADVAELVTWTAESGATRVEENAKPQKAGRNPRTFIEIENTGQLSEAVQLAASGKVADYNIRFTHADLGLHVLRGRNMGSVDGISLEFSSSLRAIVEYAASIDGDPDEFAVKWKCGKCGKKREFIEFAWKEKLRCPACKRQLEPSDLGVREPLPFYRFRWSLEGYRPDKSEFNRLGQYIGPDWNSLARLLADRLHLKMTWFNQIEHEFSS